MKSVQNWRQKQNETHEKICFYVSLDPWYHVANRLFSLWCCCCCCWFCNEVLFFAGGTVYDWLSFDWRHIVCDWDCRVVRCEPYICLLKCCVALLIFQTVSGKSKTTSRLIVYACVELFLELLKTVCFPWGNWRKLGQSWACELCVQALSVWVAKLEFDKVEEVLVIHIRAYVMCMAIGTV